MDTSPKLIVAEPLDRAAMSASLGTTAVVVKSTRSRRAIRKHNARTGIASTVIRRSTHHRFEAIVERDDAGDAARFRDEGVPLLLVRYRAAQRDDAVGGDDGHTLGAPRERVVAGDRVADPLGDLLIGRALRVGDVAGALLRRLRLGARRR